MERRLLGVGALVGLLGVVAGTFGAHGLDSRLSAEMLEVYEVGVRYQMYHALGLIGCAWAAGRFGGRLAVVAGWAFVAGVVFFSGSLYLLAVTGAKWLGMVAPVGGVAFIVGWGSLVGAGFGVDRRGGAG